LHGERNQTPKPSPKNFTNRWQDARNQSAKNTMIAASNAKTNASGNQRSDQSAMIEPNRAKIADEVPAFVASVLPEGFI